MVEPALMLGACIVGFVLEPHVRSTDVIMLEVIYYCLLYAFIYLF